MMHHCAILSQRYNVLSLHKYHVLVLDDVGPSSLQIRYAYTVHGVSMNSGTGSIVVGEIQHVLGSHSCIELKIHYQNENHQCQQICTELMRLK